jgi:4-alpha-glucanotransferase
VLPLGPPDEHGSPYASPSAFAGSPTLLAEPDRPVSADEVESFVARHPFWAGDWAAYAGRRALADQVRFEREWSTVRAYAAERGIRLIGDVPIYVAAGSADHVMHPALFQRGVVSGAPPDDLSRNGQLWGTPLFSWEMLRRTGFRWWIERLRRTFELVDLTRIDHFRGFVAYWSVPDGRRTARTGTWRRAPGRQLFDAVRRELGELPVIAEDLGVITPAVERLRDDLGFPGMVVLHWAFTGPASSPHRPENHREHAVVYTGTHDTDTAVGWYRSLPRRVRAAIGLSPEEPHWSLIRIALGSRARLAVIPVQDVLGLGSEARLNRPGRAVGNWRWRLEPGQLTGGHAARLREETEAAGRLGPEP